MEDKIKFRLKLKGKTCVFIDWANVYRWKDELKKEIDPKKLFKYLKSYKEINEIRFYFGKDIHPKSIEFLNKIKTIGYKIIDKPVKYLRIKENGIEIRKRKCDFDLEIGLDCFERLDQFTSFVFLSGDGDFITLYERLIKRQKQIVVIYESGHLGKEIWEMKKGVFKTELSKLLQIKKCPPDCSGGVIKKL